MPKIHLRISGIRTKCGIQSYSITDNPDDITCQCCKRAIQYEKDNPTFPEYIRRDFKLGEFVDSDKLEGD